MKMKLKMSNRSVKQRKSEEKLIGYVSLSFAYRFLESEGFLTKNGIQIMLWLNEKQLNLIGLIVMKFDQSSDVIYLRHLGCWLSHIYWQLSDICGWCSRCRARLMYRRERDIGITAHIWRSCGSVPIISCNVFITIRPRKGSCQRDQER